MKKNKIIAVAVVVMLMVGGLVLASCSKCPGDGECAFSGDPLKMAADAASWCFGNEPSKAEDCFGGAVGTAALSCGC